MSAATSPVGAAATDAVTVVSEPSCVRIRVGPSSVDAEPLMTVIRDVCRSAPVRVVVDLNLMEPLDASMIERIVALRRQVAETVIAIDISRRHGPLVAALLAQLLDPGAPSARRQDAG